MLEERKRQNRAYIAHVARHKCFSSVATKSFMFATACLHNLRKASCKVQAELKVTSCLPPSSLPACVVVVKGSENVPKCFLL